MAELPQMHAQKAKSYLSEPGSRAHRTTRHCSDRWLPEVRGPEESAHDGCPILPMVNRQVSDVDLLLQKLLMLEMHRDDMQKNPKWQTSDKRKKMQALQKKCTHAKPEIQTLHPQTPAIHSSWQNLLQVHIIHRAHGEDRKPEMRHHPQVKKQIFPEQKSPSLCFAPRSCR